MSLTYRISHVAWIVVAALALASLKMAYWPLVRGNELDPIVLDPADAESGRVTVLAPAEFVDEALSENVLAGNVMGRRATYMYGNLLPPSPQGFVSTGLGAALSMGSTGFVPPNDIVERTGERRTIDGIDFEFQMTPGTEAPASSETRR